jgi:putative redox protein
LRVEHPGGAQFDITVRGHVISVDQPVEDGGDDTAPTPTELFIASLAACVAFYARRYLAPARPAHRRPGRRGDVRHGRQTGPRLRINVRLIIPDGVPAERLNPLLAVVTHCTEHNTLATTPEVSITVTDARAGLPGRWLASRGEHRHRGLPTMTRCAH